MGYGLSSFHRIMKRQGENDDNVNATLIYKRG